MQIHMQRKTRVLISNDGRPLRPGNTDRDAEADGFSQRGDARHGGAERRLIFQMHQAEPQRQRPRFVAARQVVALDQTRAGSSSPDRRGPAPARSARRSRGRTKPADCAPARAQAARGRPLRRSECRAGFCRRQRFRDCPSRRRHAPRSFPAPGFAALLTPALVRKKGFMLTDGHARKTAPPDRILGAL